MVKKKIVFALVLLSSLFAKAQVSVVSIQLMPYNVTPEAMLGASIMNSGNAQQVSMISKLYNFNNELLFTVKSSSFLLNNGLNSPFDGTRKVAASEYSSNNQSDYIKTTHALPSGAFKICIDIIHTQTSEIEDQFCDEIESEFNQYLYLVIPADKDTIETTRPLLVWSHSEPFNILAQGEYYRMLLTEMKKDQSPGEALIVNSPLMAKNYLTSHSVQYPYEAPELEAGKTYAWEVQKLANGVITNKTESWQFTIFKKPEVNGIKYIALKQIVDADFYTVTDNKIYFKFTEEYHTQGNISAFIKGDKGEEMVVEVLKDERTASHQHNTKIKSTGDNRFVLDLTGQDLDEGFYIMEIKNEKKESFYLKFYITE